ncbi:MAG TPA: hypothetical protein DD619_04635 [Alphaproteobacteria bacterium]|mgnify:CR=1 FL=1|nr:hypothetical protein [Alphaproteobacteria bacterium]
MDKTFWLERRLKELHKTKLQMADVIGVSATRLTELKNGTWRFQAIHIKKVAEFLKFNRTAFLDFISGDITEEELWNTPLEDNITPEEREILRMIRQTKETNNNSNTDTSKAG